MGDAGVARAHVTGAIELDRPGDPVENLIAIMRDRLFDAQIEAGEASERVAGGKRDIVVDGPRDAAFANGQHVAGTV